MTRTALSMTAFTILPSWPTLMLDSSTGADVRFCTVRTRPSTVALSSLFAVPAVAATAPVTLPPASFSGGEISRDITIACGR